MINFSCFKRFFFFTHLGFRNENNLKKDNSLSTFRKLTFVSLTTETRNLFGCKQEQQNGSYLRYHSRGAGVLLQGLWIKANKHEKAENRLLLFEHHVSHFVWMEVRVCVHCVCAMYVIYLYVCFFICVFLVHNVSRQFSVYIITALYIRRIVFVTIALKWQHKSLGFCFPLSIWLGC